MITLQQFLKYKGSGAWSVTSTTTVFDALKTMAEKDVGALLVIDDGKLVGIVSERDYARKVALKGRNEKDTLIKDIMTEKVAYIRPDESVEDCMALMTEKHFRHLPIIDNGRIAGVISIGDVVRIVISKQKFIIAQLENYITGGR